MSKQQLAAPAVAPKTADPGISAQGARLAVAGPTPAEIKAGASASEQVEALMSYGAFDWAITDEEATKALGILGALSPAARTAAVSGLSDTAIGRLLGNIPSSERGKADFGKVVTALPEKLVAGHVKDLLSYGLFDWVISDGDMAALDAVLSALSQDETGAVLSALSREKYTRLLTNVDSAFQERMLSNLPSAADLSDAQQVLLRKMMDATPDGDLEGLIAIFVHRFGLDPHKDAAPLYGKDVGIDWEPKGLRRSYEVLEALPEAHVEGNSAIAVYVRYSDKKDGKPVETQGSGGYFWGEHHDLIAISYGSKTLDDIDTEADEGDPLRGVTSFDEVVRHEIGHAVDDRIGASESYGRTSDGGGWLDHGSNYEEVITALMAAAGPATKALGAAALDGLRTVMLCLMEESDPDLLESELADYDWYSALDQAAKDALLADTPLRALEAGMRNPWWGSDAARIDIGGRRYQESYANQWTSYEAAAWAKKVSPYQFRAPGEWFAEAYATYYQPNPQGEGALLKKTDAQTHRWIEKNVVDLANG